MRPIVGLIIVLIPFAHRLNLTDSLSVIMSLIVFCLIWENVTSLRRDAKIWEKWENTRPPEMSEVG